MQLWAGQVVPGASARPRGRVCERPWLSPVSSALPALCTVLAQFRRQGVERAALLHLRTSSQPASPRLWFLAPSPFCFHTRGWGCRWQRRESQ